MEINPFADLFSVPTTLSAVQISVDPAGTGTREGSFMNHHDGCYYLWFSLMAYVADSTRATCLQPDKNMISA